MAKSIYELSEKEFNKLKECGLLKTIYPDCEVENFEDLIPQPLENIDWSEVISQAKSHLKDITSADVRDRANQGDDEHYMYEAVMQAVYGNDIFEFINKFDN